MPKNEVLLPAGEERCPDGRYGQGGLWGGGYGV